MIPLKSFKTNPYPLISSDLDEEQSIRYAEERKYGKIPTNVYVAYLKSCGLSTLTIFFASTLLWQLFRVYTDVWLRDWTESDASDVSRKSALQRLRGFTFIYFIQLIPLFRLSTTSTFMQCCRAFAFYLHSFPV